jgi:hypothetical protein
MANYTTTANRIHKTLAANTEDVVTFGPDFRDIEVVNRNGLGELYFTVDNTPATVAGDNTYCVPGAGWMNVPIGDSNIIRLISSVAVSYSVGPPV